MPTAIDASAIMVNVTAVVPPNTGHLRVFPFSAPLPNTSVVNYVPGQDISNNTVVSQCINCDADISIFAATTANIIVDVIGYFNKPTEGYRIGDRGPAGGWVFYVTDGGRHGLEAAPEDQGNARWGCFETETPGADGIKVGTGVKNTADILAGCSEANIAAELAYFYKLNGFKDWFLPSKDELNLMWKNLANSDGDLTNEGPDDPNNLGGFDKVTYWSSTELASGNAWYQDFYAGYQGAINEGDLSLRVRAARAF